MQFMIGQRVIYSNVICTICKPETFVEHGKTWTLDTWIYNPEKGHKHSVNPSNIKPLPNGQL